MLGYRRSFTLYPLFQIPLICLCLSLLVAALFWFMGFGRPPVAVAIAIDLSGSTYDGKSWNAPGSIMNQEISAVKAYLDKNSSGLLREPNLVQVFGFAGSVIDLTTAFQDNSELIQGELDQKLQQDLSSQIGGSTNIDLAIQRGTQVLAKVGDRCRELLLVTDGVASVSTSIIEEAKANQVKINVVVIGGEDAPDLKLATELTRGIYLATPDQTALTSLFINRFFRDFNNNWRWILPWLGLAWIALMWTLVMPLDRWIFQGLLRLPFNLAGRLALFNAWFWTGATPVIIYYFYRLWNLALPFTSAC